MTRRKVLLLSLLTSCLISCGKPVENSSPSSEESDSVVERPGLNTSEIDMHLVTNPGRDTVATTHKMLPADAWVRIPSSVKVVSGSPLIFSYKFYFNTLENSSLNSPQVHCSYNAIRIVTGTDQPSEDGYNHYFKGCFQDVNGDGQMDELNYSVGHEIGIDKGNYIILVVESDNSSNILSIESEIEVDWL